MQSLLSTLGLAIVVFASTNVDDFLVLIAFFLDSFIPRSTVVIGQFIGIGFLTGLSLLAALLTVRIPEDWTGLLGLAPLVLGIQKLFALRRPSRVEPKSEAKHYWAKIGGIFSVAFVTIANGGDNLAATIPLFANQIGATWIYALVFTFMTAIWCWAALLLTKHSGIASRLGNYGRIILPLILILLGLYFLSHLFLRFR